MTVVLHRDRHQLAEAGLAQTRRAAAALQQFEDGLVLYRRSDDTFKGGVDLSE